MNTLESYMTDNPVGIVEECAKLTIDDTTVPFLLAGVTEPDSEYTFSFWVKSNINSTITAAETTFPTTSKWTKHHITFISSGADLCLYFNSVGTFYIYHPQIEIGNVVTDWTPAPEDMATNADIKDLNDDIVQISSDFSQFVIDAGKLYATVGSVQEQINKSAEGINKSISDVKKQVETTMTSDQIKAEITTQIHENGVTKVVTTTGFTFDSSGLTVDRTAARTKTTVSENGMTVYKKHGEDTQEVLVANDAGVIAEDLTASTYLIIGGRSRFENFGSNRTGCFWIGGNTNGFNV